ncbi:MAG: CHAT domain-containing protein [Saprospiraceae bacterium]|nr:CHAT domain-containing protein [Saprospiraceae bacterium]
MNISKALVVIIFCFCSGLACQTIDTLSIVQRIDSLLIKTRDHVSHMEYDQALQDCKRAEDYAEKYLGKHSIAYGNVYFQKGRINRFKGNYIEAESCYILSKNIRGSLLGENHPDYAWSLNNLGAIYLELGRFDLAEEYYLRAKSIRESVLGSWHPDYSGSLNNLANLYVKMAQFEKAEKLYLESKEIRKQTSGAQSTAFASVLNNLANLHMVMGNYDKAEAFYQEAISILRKWSSKEQAELNVSLNNLAAIYWEMTNYERAEELYIEVKSIREKMLGKHHPDYASCLNNLALLYQDKRDFKQAKAFFLESKILREKVLGKKHLDYASSLSSLANFHLQLNELDEAENLFLECNKIREKILGIEHPDFATGLKNLALVSIKRGKYEKAEAYLIEVKRIFEAVFGKQHPEMGSCIKSLVHLYWNWNKYSKAVDYSDMLLELDKVMAIKAMHHLSESELNKFLIKNGNHQAQMLSFLQQHCEKTGRQSTVSGLAYDRLLFFKGFLLNAKLHISRLAQSDSTISEILNKLKVIGRQLSAEYAKPILARTNVDVLEAQSNELEKAISRHLKEYDLAIQQTGWQAVQEALAPGEVSIEFVKYPYYERGNLTDKIMYAAIVLKAKNKTENQPIFVPLFEESSLDSLFQSKASRKADYVNQIYTLANRGAHTNQERGRSLYELIWKPLEKELEGEKTIYFSVTGLLHRIQMGAISINENEMLADRYQLRSMNSTRQLVIPELKNRTGQTALLLGGLIFDLDSLQFSSKNLIVSHSNTSNRFANIDSTLRGGSWNSLPGTEKEVKAIHQIFLGVGMQAQLKTKNEATEAYFKTLGIQSPSPNFLHIATHGYFFPDAQKEVGNNEPIFKMSEHPMLRSGLILSGGNAGWQGKRPLGEGEDGVLTAYEISQMNLSNTELVVLSACETGLGDIQGNEGVYGLQRAFKIAGAKYIIMSLWQVPDKQTSMLMITFYKKWLEAEGSPTGEKKMSIPDAFHAAQKELRDLGFDPYQWAGFVLIE